MITLVAVLGSVCGGGGALALWLLTGRTRRFEPRLGWRPADREPWTPTVEDARREPPEPGSFAPPSPIWTGPWVQAEETVRVQGYEITGGLLYVGTDLETADGESDPALIDPRLPVDRAAPDRRGETMDHWPFYGEITPEARAAYLSWLAGGRCAPDTDIGYVFLFFYGLERRALVDLIDRAASAHELAVIAEEVRRLLERYGANDSFHGYAVAFLEFIDLLILDKDDPLQANPPPREPRRRPPAALRLGLARLAAGPGRVHADWALSWAWHHPRIDPHAEWEQHPEEFRRRFRARFVQRHPDGLPVRAQGDTLYLSYRPASAGFSGTRVGVGEIGLPDVLEQPDATRELILLVAETAAESASCDQTGAEPDESTDTPGR